MTANIVTVLTFHEQMAKQAMEQLIERDVALYEGADLGEVKLAMDAWRRADAMEAERQRRLPHTFWQCLICQRQVPGKRPAMHPYCHICACPDDQVAQEDCDCGTQS